MLAAGMNELIGKPIQLGELYAKLAHWLPPAAGPVAPVRPRGAQSLRLAEAAWREAGLPEIPGLVPGPALARVSAKLPFYLQLLAEFCRDYRDFGADYAQSGPEARIRLVHTLRGTAGSLGLEDLACEAGALEDRLRAGPAAGAEARLAAELGRMLSALAPLLANQQRPDQAGGAQADVIAEASDDGAASRQAFVQALEQFDPDAAELLPQLQGLAPELREELAAALDRFDFIAAQELWQAAEGVEPG